MKFAMLLDYSNSCVLTKMCNFVAELVILLAGTLCNFEKAGLLQQETMFQALQWTFSVFCFVFLFLENSLFCVLFSYFWLCASTDWKALCVFSVSVKFYDPSVCHRSVTVC